MACAVRLDGHFKGANNTILDARPVTNFGSHPMSILVNLPANRATLGSRESCYEDLSTSDLISDHTR